MKKSIKNGFFVALSFGLIYLGFWWDYTLGYWYGGTLLEKKQRNTLFGRNYTVGDVVTIFFTIMMGGLSILVISNILKFELFITKKNKTINFKFFFYQVWVRRHPV